MLVRADLNVPMKDGKITDDTRIRGAAQTLKYLVENGAKVLLTSHLVRSMPASCSLLCATHVIIILAAVPCASKTQSSGCSCSCFTFQRACANHTMPVARLATQRQSRTVWC